MQVTIEIPDPPAGCDPAAVKWGQPPKGAWILVADIGQTKWRKHDTNTLGETAWVMPYTPFFLGLLMSGWVTHDLSSEWVWWHEKPTWIENAWYSIKSYRSLPFREVPPISGEHAIWEVPSE